MGEGDSFQLSLVMVKRSVPIKCSKKDFEDKAMKKPSANGFTLMELMITVVIIGILASIAYPSYTRYIAETRRSDATINLLRIAAQQEKFFTECGTYTTNFNGVISNPPPLPRCTGLGIGPTAATFTTSEGYYNITAAPGPNPGDTIANSFLLSAAPVATSSQFSADNAKCTTITITNTGAKDATGSDSPAGTNGGKCWKK